MKNELRDRLQTLAEMRLLDIDIGEYLEEIVQKYGEKKVEIVAAEAGLLELIGGALEKEVDGNEQPE